MKFHAKYPLFDSQSDREFTSNYAIQINIGANLPQRGSYREAHKSGEQVISSSTASFTPLCDP